MGGVHRLLSTLKEDFISFSHQEFYYSPAFQIKSEYSRRKHKWYAEIRTWNPRGTFYFWESTIWRATAIAQQIWYFPCMKFTRIHSLDSHIWSPELTKCDFWCLTWAHLAMVIKHAKRKFNYSDIKSWLLLLKILGI